MVDFMRESCVSLAFFSFGRKPPLCLNARVSPLARVGIVFLLEQDDLREGRSLKDALISLESLTLSVRVSARSRRALTWLRVGVLVLGC